MEKEQAAVSSAERVVEARVGPVDSRQQVG
jgi:hypothetical protein